MVGRHEVLRTVYVERDGEPAQPPLALNLFYLLTAYGRDNDAQRPFSHMLLGRAMSILHDHPVLGARLGECTLIVAGHDDRSAGEIFGHPDDMKFRSSMTLFEAAVPAVPMMITGIHRCSMIETNLAQLIGSLM